MEKTKSITLPRMDDPHVHFRKKDDVSEMVLGHLYESGFARAVPICNFKRPIETVWELDEEMNRLNRLNSKVEMVWSIMLTALTTPQGVREAHQAGARIIKWIPDGLSTHSKNGVSWSNIHTKFPCFYEAEKLGMWAMIHLEASKLDEAGNPITPYIWREFLPLLDFDILARIFPDMLFSIEHVSTKRVLDYILKKAPRNVSGGITAHHLFRTYYDIYEGSNVPKGNEWCMPVYKYPEDREVLISAVTSGNPKLYYASDKAPHQWKDPLNPAAGVYTGMTDICLLADLFESRGKLENLESFVSRFWAKRFGLPKNTGTVTLQKEEWVPPEEENGVQIFGAGQELNWKVASVSLT